MRSFYSAIRTLLSRRSVLSGRWTLTIALLMSLFFGTLALSGCRRGASAGGLLQGKSPTSVAGVRDPSRLTDGQVPSLGSGWNTNRTSVLSSRHARVDFDLGSSQPVFAAALLGDNNDIYQLLGSDDGQRFEVLWSAPRVGRPGMQWRSVTNLKAKARYLRFQAGEGDASLSLGEVAVYGSDPGPLPPRLTEVSAGDGNLEFRNAFLVFVGGALVLVALAYAGMPLSVLLGLLGLFAFTAFGAIRAYLSGHPFGAQEVSLIRAGAATLGLLVAAREAFWPARYRPLSWVNLPVLGVAASLSLAAFFNLGEPQFFDEKNREPSVVHNYDMRVYFPVAKYFKELRYDGLYVASVATYAEEHGGLSSPEVLNTELRDLRDHRMRRVRDILPEVEAVKRRFSPERWAELKGDMRYFWETMGRRGYLGSMADHGGNATPVWLAIAHLMFRSATASNGVLLLTGLLDPLLLLVFAFFVFRTFGARTALISLILFGANDYYMFGSNWAGATLRNDWMVYLGLGACALKAERFRLGGALLALSALIRAFPAVTLFTLVVPVGYYVLDFVRAEARLPKWKELARDQKWFVDAALGATICVVVSVLFSSVVLGLDAWPLWVKKISSFTASPHVNHISLLTVTSGSEHFQAQVFRSRWLLHAALTIAYVGLAIWAAYRRPPHVAALLGICMVPVFMYPANYYMHFVFLLALFVEEPLRAVGRQARESSGRVWGLLLAMCAALYLTVKEQPLELHFYNASVILMSTLLLVLVALLPRDESGELILPWVRSEP